MKERTFLGLDLSTQSITALVVDPEEGRTIRRQLQFDRDFAHYDTVNGVLSGDEPNEFLAPPLMWVEALDSMLELLKDEGLTNGIAAISVSAQQHGSVYLSRAAVSAIHSLNPEQRPHEQLAGLFTRDFSPIWMDSSTSVECEEISSALGGDQEVARLTGSVATERFAGPQIRKFWKRRPEAYQETAHITLISAFITSLLIGGTAPLDCGDGLGMNLVDTRTRTWSPKALDAAAPGLADKLPPVVDRDRFVGRVSDNVVRRYGFNPECQVLVGTGDNPASLAGLGLVGDENTRAISLGTSDTYFGYISAPLSGQGSVGHLFGAADGGLMFLLCFKNGSLARERVRNRYGLDWQGFSNILMETRPGNRGRIMLPYFISEITPVVLEPGAVRFGGLDAEDSAGNVRAVAEAQVMSMALHSEWTGSPPGNILVTAGGSENEGLLKLIAQVFGVRVRAFELTDAAALGAALRAAGHWLRQQGENVNLADLSRKLAEAGRSKAVEASLEETAVFRGEDGLLSVYAACEDFHLAGGPDPQPFIDRFRRRYA